jgi:hypothetical protein
LNFSPHIRVTGNYRGPEHLSNIFADLREPGATAACEAGQRENHSTALQMIGEIPARGLPSHEALHPDAGRLVFSLVPRPPPILRLRADGSALRRIIDLRLFLGRILAFLRE